MRRAEVREKIKETGIVAAVRVNSKEDALFAAEEGHKPEEKESR